VARGICGIIFENPRGFLLICGLWVDFGKDEGPKCKVPGNGIFQELFC
jgi:hypothetical protein